MSLFSQIDGVIQKRWKDLQKPEVIAVRPGHKFTGGWITDKPAIVVRVDSKRDDVRPEDALPAKLDGVAVDVRPATLFDKLRQLNPVLHARLTESRSEFHDAPFSFRKIDDAARTRRGARGADHSGKETAATLYASSRRLARKPHEDHVAHSSGFSSTIGSTWRKAKLPCKT
jgi:hypothetical protein